jgi:putative effector of murein hydrolase LrgA (UPF0299 family)
MKNKKPFLNMDERNKQIAYKTMSAMYIITIVSLQFIILYRQLILKQALKEFEDMAILATVNSLFLVTGLLYFGAIPIQRIKIKTILFFYFLILILGSAFVWLKYKWIADIPLSNSALLEKISIVASITGIIVLFWVLFSWLGKRKLEKELE